MNFYAAESGEPVAAERLLDETIHAESDYGNPDWSDTDTMQLGNGTEFTYISTHVKNSDGEVIRWGDPNGDHIWEINTTHGYPYVTVQTDGSHTGRGGLSKIEVGLECKPLFVLPKAPLWVDDPDMVNFQGNASVIGDSTDTTICEDVPDVLHRRLLRYCWLPS